MVLAIVMILASQMAISLTSSKAKLKGEAFSFRGDLILAKSEAVKRNTDILVEFVANCEYESGSTTEIDASSCGSGTMDGYRICVDGTVPPNKSCDDAEDTRIKDVLLRQEVQYYGTFAIGSFPTGGPTDTESGTDLESSASYLDGIVFSNTSGATSTSTSTDASDLDSFELEPDGSCDECDINGNVIIYIPDNNNTISAGPYALVVTAPGVIKLYRWDIEDGSWDTK